MNILGSIQKWGSAIYRLVDGSDAKSVPSEEKSTPDDNDGPGAGGGYNDNDSFDVRPNYDGPGAGGGYFTGSEEKAVSGLYDGPGAGGGYNDGDGLHDGPGAGGGYFDDVLDGVQVSGTVKAKWPSDSFTVGGYLVADAANENTFTITSDLAATKGDWSPLPQAFFADSIVKNQASDEGEKK